MSRTGLLASLLLFTACQAPGAAQSSAARSRPAAPSIVVQRSEVVLIAENDLAPDAKSQPTVGVGTAALVEWGGVYYPATVLAVVDDGHLKIHYTGYGGEWDEVVSLERVVVGDRLDGSPIGESSQPNDTSYTIGSAQVGDLVDVEWGGSWWPARVERLVSTTRVEIHYDGYGHEWDEVVEQARIRARALQSL